MDDPAGYRIASQCPRRTPGTAGRIVSPDSLIPVFSLVFVYLSRPYILSHPIPIRTALPGPARSAGDLFSSFRSAFHLPLGSRAHLRRRRKGRKHNDLMAIERLLVVAVAPANGAGGIEGVRLLKVSTQVSHALSKRGCQAGPRGQLGHVRQGVVNSCALVAIVHAALFGILSSSIPISLCSRSTMPSICM